MEIITEPVTGHMVEMKGLWGSTHPSDTTSIQSFMESSRNSMAERAERL